MATHCWPFVGIQRSSIHLRHKETAMRNFEIFFVISPNKLLNKQLSCWWFEAPWQPRDVTVLYSACARDVIKWKHFPRYWPFVRGIHRPPVVPLTKVSDTDPLCLLWSAPEQTVQQTIEALVIWNAIALIMTSLWWVCLQDDVHGVPAGRDGGSVRESALPGCVRQRGAGTSDRSHGEQGAGEGPGSTLGREQREGSTSVVTCGLFY